MGKKDNPLLFNFTLAEKKKTSFKQNQFYGIPHINVSDPKEK